MKALSMNPKFDREIKHLDSSLTTMLEVLKDYSENQLNRKAKNGGWSALQTMHHLLLSEKLSLDYVEKKLSFNPELKRAGLMAAGRSLILNNYMKLPFKFKSPEANGTAHLPERSSFWETAKTWKQERSRLRHFLEELPQDLHNKEIYKHPAAGRVSLGSMLEFHQVHFNRHRKQIFRVLDEY